MGSRIPVISGRDAARAFERFGWVSVRQASSHIILIKAGEPATLSVPDHKEVARGTLRSLIRSANLTVEQFVQSCDSGSRRASGPRPVTGPLAG